MDGNKVRVAHISDMHCFHLSFNPMQFLSKWWVGNINGFINRQMHYHADPNPTLIELFKHLHVDYLFFSGDLTTTALASEFAIVKEFTDSVEAAGIPVLTIPGNHDKYTVESEKAERFYDYFPCPPLEEEGPLSYDMREHRVSARKIGANWWWVGADSTKATKLFSARGIFPRTLEHHLDTLLGSIPETDNVALVNHYPMFATPHPSHNLERAPALRDVLRKHPNVKLYMHGHVHRLSISDRRRNGLPIILNSGSCGSKRRASCFIVDLHNDGCIAQSYRSRGNADHGFASWRPRKKATFTW